MSKSRSDVGFDIEKGAADVESLGGFATSDKIFLDHQHSDFVRRRILTTWFGHHGGQWAWVQYRTYRSRQRRARTTREE